MILDKWYPSSICATSTCTVDKPVTLGGGSHSWWIRTWNSAGYGPWSTTASFSTTMPTPPTDVKLNDPATIPQNGASLETNYTPSFTWKKVDTATWYELYISGPNGMILDKWYPSSICVGSTCTVDKPVTLGGGSHSWWIRTWNSAGYGPWSTTASFSTTMPTVPAAVSNLLPTGTSTNAPTFTWDIVNMATSYRLYVKGPSGVIKDQWYRSVDICDTTTCSVSSSTLNNGDYIWWVQTYNSVGYGPWKSSSFKVSP
jgi:hypothetical protein